MKSAPETPREKLILWLNENTTVSDCNKYFSPVARNFDWFTDDQLREIIAKINNGYRFTRRIWRENNRRLAKHQETRANV